MSKALSIVILLNLIVSAGVVTFGTLSFLDREVLKTQAVELESSFQTLADELKWAEEVAWETPEEKKPLVFNLPRPQSAEELAALEDSLNEMVRFATQRQAQLSLRYNELVSTQDQLEQTRQTLATRQRELTAARNRQAQLTRTLEEVRGNLQEANQQVATANRDKQNLDDTISRLNTQITDLNNELASLEIDLETRIQERDLAQAEYDRCRLGAAGDDDGPSEDVRGQRATVMAVNPDWQYVVIDKGMINNVELNLQGFVHRGKDYVGKLQVVRVEDTVAVAAIIDGSVEPGDAIRPGDKLFF